MDLLTSLYSTMQNIHSLDELEALEDEVADRMAMATAGHWRAVLFELLQSVRAKVEAIEAGWQP